MCVCVCVCSMCVCVFIVLKQSFRYIHNLEMSKGMIVLTAPSGNSINSILPSIDCPEAKVAVQLAHAYIALYRKVTKSDVKLDTVKNIGYDIYKDEDVKRLICKIISKSITYNRPSCFVLAWLK